MKRGRLYKQTEKQPKNTTETRKTMAENDKLVGEKNYKEIMSRYNSRIKLNQLFSVR